MFAIVQNGGKQYKVAQGDTLVVDRLDAEAGQEIELGPVLLLGGDEVRIGTPHVEGARVTARVVGHHKGAKVITFKYRPRKRMRRRVGFRHSHTTLEITGIEA